MGAKRVYALLSALLFTACCAYFGAALFEALQRPRTNIAPAAKAGGGPELYGILLREEETVSPAFAASLAAGEGERICAREGLRESALFYPRSDGYEFLSPEDAAQLTAEKLNELLSSRAESIRGGKLIYGFDQYYAAFYSGEKELSPGFCRLKFEGFEESRRAEILSVSQSGEDRAVLIRLMCDKESLSLRLCRAELIY